MLSTAIIDLMTAEMCLLKKILECHGQTVKQMSQFFKKLLANLKLIREIRSRRKINWTTAKGNEKKGRGWQKAMR